MKCLFFHKYKKVWSKFQVLLTSGTEFEGYYILYQCEKCKKLKATFEGIEIYSDVNVNYLLEKYKDELKKFN